MFKEEGNEDPPPTPSSAPSPSWGPTRTLGDKVDEAIAGFFYKIRHACSSRPKTTIAVTLAVSALCTGGILQLTTENRPEKLWVPQEDLESVLGNPAFDGAGDLVSAEALSMAYFLQDRSKVEGGNTVDPVNEAWEEQVFLETVQDGAAYPSLDLAYLSTRSFPNKDPSVRPAGAPSPGPTTSAPTTPASPRCGE